MALEEIKGTQLEAIWRTSDRQPKYRVEIWNPRLSRVQDVVLGRTLSPSYDISAVVERVNVQQTQVFENNDDAVSSRITLRIVWPDNGVIELRGGQFLTFSEKLFREGTAIRVYEGDARVNPEEWPPIFTGSIRGFPGAEIGKRGKKVLNVSAFGRALSFQRQSIVGFSFGYNTDLGDAAVRLALTEMQLEREEIRFGEFGYVTRHKANALTQIGKMRGLYELMATVDRKPYFDGAGRLVSHITNFDRAPVWILDSSPIVIEIERVQNLRAVKNSVQVIGLNFELSKVVQASTKLGEWNTTLGYFDTHHREIIHYSKDKRRRAEDTYIDVLHKADFGSDVDWQEIDEFSGKITIDTGYAPWVVGLIITVWVVLSLLEYALDYAIGTGGLLATIFSAGTLQILRLITQIAKAAAMVSLLVAMTRIGRYRIEVRGKPFDFVFEELRSIAHLRDVPVADQDELEISHHWLSTIEDTDAKAREHLRRELSKTQTYRLTLASNGLIEVDDLIAVRDPSQGLDRFSVFYVAGIQKTLNRGPATDTMTLTAWKVTERGTIDDLR